ncbi:(2Fe-2S)-binding protein [Microbispora sp. NBRC 16548]|uniref:(2Fe-2S)-binding protein n=1 Tax=Microbispora sp. NBRC 16548 TaxID=3030994 RepID=UPI0024A5EED5|nr:(2Fe-2S)-binding protein [Microbispora sp. NBRC 16548]GLX10186.1 proline dehydrogenase subunit delta [Microbispora sp. NBRC 16548]
MGKTIICPCHDVTVEDIRAMYAAGYTHPETLKRATAVFMGPCQGKHCAGPVMELLRELSGGDEGRVSRRPTARPPLRPVLLGVLAGAAGLSAQTGPETGPETGAASGATGGA